MGINQIRKYFLSFFQSKKHIILNGGPIVLKQRLGNDDNLLFTNSGMVQFKDLFLNKKEIIFKRVVTTQLCLRAGGKYNDLENIGFTKRHHTLFEMLGNFSFDDYFKKDAIFFAWEFMTKILSFKPTQLCVSVFKDDCVSANIWRKLIGLSSSQLLIKGKVDNFWAMGQTGPCGPCTEIYFDRGENLPVGHRFIELWNIVFLEFNRLKTGEFFPLNRKFIDTGMGLERLVSVLQGVFDNYKIDFFQDILKCLDELTLSKDKIYSKRVIADHLRACIFLISEGLVPSNNGAGYVLRRILRRAFYHVTKLQARGVFLSTFIPYVIDILNPFYINFIGKKENILNVVKKEEEQFLNTLSNGLYVLDRYIMKSFCDILTGDVLFKIHDTYGFPLGFILDILHDKNLHGDISGFRKFFKQCKYDT